MKTTSSIRFLAFPLAVLVLAVAGCDSLPKVKMPAMKMPKVPTPFAKQQPAPDDPRNAYDLRRPLMKGDTLKLAVYRNFLSPARAFQGYVMIDSTGNVHFDKVGDVHVAGKKAYDAVRAIEGAFSREIGDSTISVQLFDIEDVPVVTVSGAVRHPGVYAFTEGLTAEGAVSLAGGRASSAEARALHVTRNGIRKFHVHSGGVVLEAGDVVNFSRDI